MYSKEFCNIYNKYGWDYLIIIMGNAILKHFKTNKKVVNSHLDLTFGTGTLCNLFYSYKKGIDISEKMIKLAKNNNDKICFYINDMTNYSDVKTYNLITITCDAVNLF